MLFPHIDLAILPIAPVEPRRFMEFAHEDPREALSAFEALGTRWMVPIHFETFVNSTDEVGDARRILTGAMAARGIGADRVHVLSIGEQVVLMKRPGLPL